MSIPKILHYCWFGGDKFPRTEARCFHSWQSKMADFTFRKWDGTNFDLNCNLYVQKAAEAKKWMYVSDYARLQALYEEGGVYLDTDCYVLRSFAPLLTSNGLAITGFGGDNHEIAAHAIAAPPGHPFIKECLDSYTGQNFYRADGTMDTTSINIRMTNLLEAHGFLPNGNKQITADMIVYPMTYFCPISFLPETVPDCKSKDTYCVHIWSDPHLKLERNILYKMARRIKRLIWRPAK